MFNFRRQAHGISATVIILNYMKTPKYQPDEE
jgi:hypothetical protein